MEHSTTEDECFEQTFVGFRKAFTYLEVGWRAVNYLSIEICFGLSIIPLIRFHRTLRIKGGKPHWSRMSSIETL